MTFDELLDQAIDLLRRRGRITYRMLRRQFDLDDDLLDDLKFELIKGQRLAADEDGEVLVWIGEQAPAQQPPPRRRRNRSPRFPHSSSPRCRSRGQAALLRLPCRCPKKPSAASSR